ncbi:metal-dependent transcriptional regulator [bacterium SCSIO 12741]|nr:metal-dependent transcriptional regulator [bacterium SCSIO 12741]
MNSLTEENYLKEIYSLLAQKKKPVSTNELAKRMRTKASSVTDMVKKLSSKDLVHYKPYHGVTLSDSGKRTALNIIRKHRIWETFLVEKLHFNWDEVHEIAEQLEHIQSPELIRRLHAYIGSPDYDPHGSPIPSEDGEIIAENRKVLGDLAEGESAVIVGVKNSSKEFLKHLDKLNLHLGTTVTVKEVNTFDYSMQVNTQQKDLVLSDQVCSNLFIKPMNTQNG